MIKDYVFYDAQGFIKIAQSCTPEEAACVQRHTGLSMVLHHAVDPFAHVVFEGGVQPITAEAAEEAMRRATPTPEDMAADIRKKRSTLLQASDWTQLPDAPAANKEAWAAYRQALRDVTSQPDPFNITWPVAPV